MNKIESELLQTLNPEQLAAVTYPNDQSLLVLAGAGSGKTKVLTSRIVWLLYTQQSLPQNILAVTFTNKAANEMRLRVEQLLPYSIQDMWLGTFHSLCHRLLRRNHEAAQLQSNFQVIDTQDQLSIVKRILKDADVREHDITPKELLNYVNNSKEQGNRSDSPFLTRFQQYHLLNRYYEIYEHICYRENLVDFTELLLRCVEMLRSNPTLQQSIRQHFRYILVDEFQDTNDLQYQWLKLIKGKASTIFTVGDDDQSIYSFRGANVKNMQYLMKDFNIEQPIKLEQNYRSTQIILDAANHLIALNKNRIGKNLKSTQKQGELIKYIRTYSDSEESQHVLEEIKLLNNIGQEYSTMAILYRNNAQSRVIEQSLFNANIPYKVYGGLRFYERAEIKHALAYLRLLVNPDDNYSLLRIINFPNRGIGAKSIENLQTQADIQNTSLWEIILQEKNNNNKIANFYQLIQGLQDKIDILSFPNLMSELIQSSGLIDYYQQKKGDFQSKIDNLNELVNATFAFEQPDINLLWTENLTMTSSREIIIAFLSNASLEAGERSSENAEDATDFVQLMTIHSAKGLEFDTVFLIGMEEGLFPNERSINSHNDLEEERRLMYVAITRAKKRLYMSSVYERYYQGSRKVTIESRFIKELPDKLIHHLSPRESPPIIYGSADAPLSRLQENMVSHSQDEPYTLGCMVRHPNFGTGVIIKKHKKANSHLLTINFGKNGIKSLDSAFANLEAIN